MMDLDLGDVRAAVCRHCIGMKQSLDGLQGVIKLAGGCEGTN